MHRAAFLILVWIWAEPTTAPQDSALSGQLTGGIISRTVQDGETLAAIGSRYGVDWPTLARDNALDSPDRLQAGRVLQIDNRHIVPKAPFDTGILVNVPQRMLFYFVDGRLLRAYPVAVGRVDWPTPTGAFRIVGRDANPTWLVPASVQEEMQREGRPVVREVPPGPGNPLGAFRLRLDDPAYSIHGTDAPGSIYQFLSHGCIRLHPDDIAELFELVRVGTPVRIIYQPVLLAVLPDGGVFLEVHPDVYGLAPEPARTLERLVRERGLETLDPVAAARMIEEAEGVARPVIPGSASAEATDFKDHRSR